MAYVKHQLAALIEVDPKAAAKQICDAYVEGKASQRDAAAVLGVNESTYYRWVKLLDLSAALEKLKAKAKKEGWHHEQFLQSPGQPVGGWKKKKSA